MEKVGNLFEHSRIHMRDDIYISDFGGSLGKTLEI